MQIIYNKCKLYTMYINYIQYMQIICNKCKLYKINVNYIQ